MGLGVFSASRTGSSNLQQVLAEHALSQTGARAGQHLGEAIIAGQMAITLVLLTGAGLLGRSLLSVLSVDPGFRTENIVVASLALPPADTDAIKIHHVAFLNQLLTRLRAIPGVEDAGGTGELPLAEDMSDGNYVVMNPEDRPPTKNGRDGGVVPQPCAYGACLLRLGHRGLLPHDGDSTSARAVV